jgi:hypothetical protein
MKNFDCLIAASASRVLAVLLIFVLYVVTAQPGPPDDPSQAPLDGGLALLLGASASSAAICYKTIKNAGNKYINVKRKLL